MWLSAQIQCKSRRLITRKAGKAPVLYQGMKGQNLSFIISSIRLFFKKNPIERSGSPLTLVGGFSQCQLRDGRTSWTQFDDGAQLSSNGRDYSQLVS